MLRSAELRALSQIQLRAHSGSNHISFTRFGSRSVLPASCGTQKLCITSAEVSFINVGCGCSFVLSGTCSSFAVTTLYLRIAELPPELVSHHDHVQRIRRLRRILYREDHPRRPQEQYHDDAGSE